jgi:hypothetical protein
MTIGLTASGRGGGPVADGCPPSGRWLGVTEAINGKGDVDPTVVPNGPGVTSAVLRDTAVLVMLRRRTSSGVRAKHRRLMRLSAMIVAVRCAPVPATPAVDDSDVH